MHIHTNFNSNKLFHLEWFFFRCYIRSPRLYIALEWILCFGQRFFIRQMVDIHINYTLLWHLTKLFPTIYESNSGNKHLALSFYDVFDNYKKKYHDDLCMHGKRMWIWPQFSANWIVWKIIADAFELKIVHLNSFKNRMWRRLILWNLLLKLVNRTNITCENSIFSLVQMNPLIFI